MTVRAFIILLAITVAAIWGADRFARDFAAPGIERTFAVLALAAIVVAPAAWLLGRLGWINPGRIEFGSKRQPPRTGGQA